MNVRYIQALAKQIHTMLIMHIQPDKSLCISQYNGGFNLVSGLTFPHWPGECTLGMPYGQSMCNIESNRDYHWQSQPASFQLALCYLYNLYGNSFYHAALLDFPNVIGLNGSTSGSETSHFVGVVMLKTIYPLFYSHNKIEIATEECMM